MSFVFYYSGSYYHSTKQNIENDLYNQYFGKEAPVCPADRRAAVGVEALCLWTNPNEHGSAACLYHVVSIRSTGRCACAILPAIKALVPST